MKIRPVGAELYHADGLMDRQTHLTVAFRNFANSSKHGINQTCLFVCLFLIRQPPPPHWARASSFTRFLVSTQQRTTVGRPPLDEWSARRRDLYLTTHNRHTSMPLMEFEPTFPAGKRPQIYALDRAANGIGNQMCTTQLMYTDTIIIIGFKTFSQGVDWGQEM
jgi:hypothetical protein